MKNIEEKVGSRIYWESWEKDIAKIAQTYTERINILLEKDDFEINKIFEDFVLTHNPKEADTDNG